MPQAFPVVEFGVMTALLGIKFLVSKIRNREGCRPLGMKKSRKEEDSKYRKVKILTLTWKYFYFGPHTQNQSPSPIEGFFVSLNSVPHQGSPGQQKKPPT